MIENEEGRGAATAFKAPKVQQSPVTPQTGEKFMSSVEGRTCECAVHTQSDKTSVKWI